MKIKYAFFWVCSTCNEPSDTFNVCKELGFNPGTDGHMFNNPKQAKKVWDKMIHYLRLRSEDKRINELQANIKLFGLILEEVQERDYERERRSRIDSISIRNLVFNFNSN